MTFGDAEDLPLGNFCSSPLRNCCLLCVCVDLTLQFWSVTIRNTLKLKVIKELLVFYLFYTMPLGRPECRWNDSIEVAMTEIQFDNGNQVCVQPESVPTDGI
jgi:hypothetical protein